MATRNKKLSRAKAENAYVAIAVLLEGTDHDARMSYTMRTILEDTNVCLDKLIKQLREDERNGK